MYGYIYIYLYDSVCANYPLVLSHLCMYIYIPMLSHVETVKMMYKIRCISLVVFTKSAGAGFCPSKSATSMQQTISDGYECSFLEICDKKFQDVVQLNQIF